MSGLDKDRAAAPGLSRRDLLVGGVCLAAAGTAYARMPRHRLASIGKGQLEKLAPDKIGGWRYETASGVVLPPPDELARLLYDQQVARTYTSDTDLPMMLVMAYGSSQGGMLQVHRPEICYPASGFRLTGTMTQPLEVGGGHTIPIRSFTASSDIRTEQVIYWTRIGKALPTSWTGQRIAIMESNLAGYVPDGLLVRVSTVDTNAKAATAALERFVRAMLAEVGVAGRQQLIGAAAA